MTINCLFCNNSLKPSKTVAHCAPCMKSFPDFYISFFLTPDNSQIESALISPVDSENIKFSVDLDISLNQISICTWTSNFFFDSTYFPPQPIPQFHSLTHLMEIAEQSARRFNKLKTFL